MDKSAKFGVYLLAFGVWALVIVQVAQLLAPRETFAQAAAQDVNVAAIGGLHISALPISKAVHSVRLADFEVKKAW